EVATLARFLAHPDWWDKTASISGKFAGEFDQFTANSDRTAAPSRSPCTINPTLPFPSFAPPNALDVVVSHPPRRSSRHRLLALPRYPLHRSWSHPSKQSRQSAPASRAAARFPYSQANGESHRHIRPRGRRSSKAARSQNSIRIRLPPLPAHL